MHYFLLELYFAHSYLHSFPTRRSSDLYFGPTYDVHGGGSDLIFPHHEAEIAQAEGLTGKEPLARYWLHTGLLSIKGDRKSTRLNSSHLGISYAVFCLKKKKQHHQPHQS